MITMLDAIRRFAESAEGFDDAWMADDGLLKALYEDPDLLEALCASVGSEGHLLAAEAYVVADGPQGALDVLSTRVRDVDDPVCFARLVEVFVDAPMLGNAVEAMDAHLGRADSEDAGRQRSAWVAAAYGALARQGGGPKWAERAAKLVAAAGGVDSKAVRSLPGWASAFVR